MNNKRTLQFIRT